MKRAAFPIILLFCLIITFFSCSNTPKRPRKPVSTIVIQPNKKSYVSGEKVSVIVNTKIKGKDAKLEKVKLYYNNKLINESDLLDFTTSGIEIESVGSNYFRAEAVKTDGLKNSRSKSFIVYSEIVPEKLTYRTVNNFPHSVESYTQGLEFHQGYLYEGTGENGKSGIYKLKVSTGEVLKSFSMDKKYFGEGITILNDKIYQLTYRSQKGFIYDLNNFAVLDSFTYASEQGWGLTNDGSSLIMSDGSHVLTWLNPVDFSVVKKIQVSSNLGIRNNINELEYINGIIYANVYTTNLIITIDPETGKVLSEINLSGIVKMYTNPGEKIDYLNGIAYDAEQNRFFITGKLWPRLFEVEFVSAN